MINIKKIKPIFITYENEISDSEANAVLHGLIGIIKESEINEKSNQKKIDIHINEKPYVLGNVYYDSKKKQFDGEKIFRSLERNLYNSEKDNLTPYYFIFVTNKDIYQPGTNFVIGLASEGEGTIISTNRFQNVKDQTLKEECIKTEVIHEMGHVFGLIPDYRQRNVEYSLGKHCSNICTMRQGLILPEDWIKITKDRLKYGTFCPECKTDLRHWFDK